MRQQSEQHREARLLSTFQALVARAEDDILAELKHPRRMALTVNDDRKARWAAVQRLILMGRVKVLVPETKRLTRRDPPGGGKRRERLEIRVYLPEADAIDGNEEMAEEERI